jgi:hypothetical protein
VVSGASRNSLVRAALGAGAARCVDCCSPRTSCSLWAAMLGLVIAMGGVRMLVALAERYSPRARNEIRPRWRGARFTLLLEFVVAFSYRSRRRFVA